MTKRIRAMLEILSLLVVLGVVLFLLLYWRSIPEQVPTHFDGKGQPTNWGDKMTLLILPIVGVVAYFLLTGCNALALAVSKDELPSSAGVWLSAFKLLLLLPFTVMTVFAALARPLPAWFTPISILLPFMPITCLVVEGVRRNAARRR